MSNGVPVEIYVDNLSGIMLGYPTSKLTFVTIRQDNPNNDPENLATGPGPVPVLTVTMSTQTLINVCNAVLGDIRVNQDALLIATQNATKLLTESLSESLVQPQQVEPNKRKKS